MADNSDVPSEGMLSFKVKTSGDKTHNISISESATVLDLKNKLAGGDFENIPAERQRLIYSGRVMKDNDALSTYKIKPGNTVHMVKSAASNPAPAASSSSTPTPAAVPQNMASGTSANNPLAGLTGARFAGHANLPSASLFGADGGMGAPPSEEEMANMLENPAVLSTMNEALNNPSFIDYMIQSNPMLRNMPNARELLQSPYFRNMMTNPESIRAAARMRRAMGQGGGPAAFPAPGATDTTPADAPSSNATTGNNNAGQPPNPLGLQGMFPGLGGGFGGPNDFMGLFGGMPPMPQAAPAAGSNPASPPAAGTSPAPEQRNATGSPAPNATGGSNAQANPFAALFGGMPGAAGGGAAGQDPFTAFGLPTPTPEQIQQVMQLMGGAGGGAGAGFPGGLGGLGGFGGFGSPTAGSPPPDTRPPEERYAEQLRQLNDMGFFDFDRNVEALRRSGGSVQGAIEHLLG